MENDTNYDIKDKLDGNLGGIIKGTGTEKASTKNHRCHTLKGIGRSFDKKIPGGMEQSRKQYYRYDI
jgi:hypothetical protein